MFNSVSLPNNDFAIFSIYPYYNSYNTTLFVTDSDGVTRWAKSYKTYNNFSTFSGVQTDNGDYYIAASGKRPDLGQNNTSAYFIKTDSLGNSSCSDTTIANLDSTYSLIEDVWSLNDTIANLSSQNLNLTTNFNFSIYDICNSIISANSINDIGDKEMVYPNPFSDIIYIESENKISEKSILTIYNYSGECILKINLEQTINRIDLSGFANGVYHIKVKCAYKEWSKNIIKL
ncbi:MAG: T9SS type A sorting domain-containing protein [Bacteroidetes bacterium]|nr:T9SS type A sorting domain-containing protein [Bacteroidota bacterium]